jgi:predicted kinase
MTMKINKPKMIIMVGLPASGKSTWIKKHNKNYTVVELDWIRREVLGHQFHREAEPFVIGIGKAMVRMLLEQGKNVIIDATCLSEFIRREWIRMGQVYDAEIRVVHINTDVETCIKRDKMRKEKKVGVDVIKNLFITYEYIPMVQYASMGIKVTEVNNV